MNSLRQSNKIHEHWNQFDKEKEHKADSDADCDADHVPC